MLRPRIVEIIDRSLGLKNGNRIFTSLEGENPGGSIKDHMVWGELQGLRKPQGTSPLVGVSEVSAGSTAASLAYYCRQWGLKCVLFVPTTASAEILSRLRSLGAEVHQEELKNIYEKYDELMASRKDLHRFDQLFDEGKRRHYHAFGSTVLKEVRHVHAICGAVGTGHSLRGISEGLATPCPVLTAEPEPSYKISGVRNIAQDRYGDKDTLTSSCFTQRIIIPEMALLPNKAIQTTEGEVLLGPSFSLVLAAVKTYLIDKTGQNIFAVGAALRRP